MRSPRRNNTIRALMDYFFHCRVSWLWRKSYLSWVRTRLHPALKLQSWGEKEKLPKKMKQTHPLDRTPSPQLSIWAPPTCTSGGTPTCTCCSWTWAGHWTHPPQHLRNKLAKKVQLVSPQSMFIANYFSTIPCFASTGSAPWPVFCMQKHSGTLQRWWHGGGAVGQVVPY